MGEEDDEEFFMVYPEKAKFIKATKKYLNSIIDEFNLWASELNNSEKNQTLINYLIFDLKKRLIPFLRFCTVLTVPLLNIIPLNIF